MDATKEIYIDNENTMSVKGYFSEYFAELVNLIRQEGNGINPTLDEIAKDINMSKGALSLYLRGDREPRISSLMAIARYLKVSPNDLLGYRKETERDTGAVDASVYTGLSLDALKVLQKKKDDPFFMLVLNFLIEDCGEDGTGVLEQIADYTSSDLWDDLASDERYNTLPGSAYAWPAVRGESTAEYIRKQSLLTLTDILPGLRKNFHDLVIACNEKEKRKYVKEFAMREINTGIVEQILYHPIILALLKDAKLLAPGHIALTDELIDELEEQIRKIAVKNDPKIEDFQGTTPFVFCSVDEYGDTTAVTNSYLDPIAGANHIYRYEGVSAHRQQALSYLKEYRDYLKTKKKPSSL